MLLVQEVTKIGVKLLEADKLQMMEFSKITNNEIRTPVTVSPKVGIQRVTSNFNSKKKRS
jgi:hypothetical protein